MKKDLAEFIRCKDCVYWDPSPASKLATEYHQCNLRERFFSKAEDYCSRGETDE